ncbi:MAG: helicase HerA-like domain-containing protein, partial [Chthoniobacterales bacterium]
AKIIPPRSQVGAITPEQRKQIISSSAIAGHYEKAVDRESAYEKLQARAEQKSAGIAAPTAAQPSAPGAGTPSVLQKVESIFQPTIGPRGAIHDSVATSMAKSAMRAASSQVGRQLIRGVLGGIFGGTSSRR